jgi:DNA-binding beta-propeller fold protein YncE
MHVSAQLLGRYAASGLALGLVLAACGGSPVATLPPTAVATVAPSVVAATLIPTAPAPAPSAAPLTLLWQAHGPAKATTETYWPAIDPVTGNVWVASSFDNQYWIFKPDGTFVESWGVGGKGDGQFDLTTHDQNPDGAGAIAFAPDGGFFVADVGNYRVEKFDKNRKFVRKWGSFGTDNGQFTNPKGIATDGKTVYVADDGNGMQAFDANGGFLRKFDFPFVLFSLTPTGNLVTADFTNLLDTFDGYGKQLSHVAIDPGIVGGYLSQAVLDAAGNVFVGLQVDSGPVGLVELDPAGKQIGLWSTGAETLVLARDGGAAYMAYTGPSLSGWPYLRKYALPTP